MENKPIIVKIYSSKAFDSSVFGPFCNIRTASTAPYVYEDVRGTQTHGFITIFECGHAIDVDDVTSWAEDEPSVSHCLVDYFA